MPNTVRAERRYRQLLIASFGLALACGCGPAIAGAKEAFDALNKKDYATALREFQSDAQKGEPRAKTWLGVMYVRGWGVREDLGRAVEYFLEASGQGDKDASLHLGRMYLGLHGLRYDTKTRFEENPALGIEFLEDATKGTSKIAAADELVFVYTTGLGGRVKRDNEKLLRWWLVREDLEGDYEAAKQGDALAARRVARAFSHEPGWPDDPVRITETIRWYVAAQKGVKLDGVDAKRFACAIEKARSTNIEISHVDVGTLRRIAYDIEGLEQKARTGDVRAMTQLGYAHYSDCFRDLGGAKSWFERAARAGDLRAAWALYDIAEDNDPSKKQWERRAQGRVGSIQAPPSLEIAGGGDVFEGPLRTDAYEGYRHAPGEAFLVTKSAPLYARPDATAPIIGNAGGCTRLYARPVGGGWYAAVVGSEACYPSPWQSPGSAEVKDGKFVVPPRLDRSRYARLAGYLRGDALASLDVSPSRPPLPSNAFEPVPQYWRELGFDDPRKFIIDPSIPPFDAIVRIEAKSGKSCSGTLVADKSTVLTAAHCFLLPGQDTIDRTSSVNVVAIGKDRKLTTISATVQDAVWVAKNGTAEVDWAVLKLSRPLQAVSEPLEIYDLSKKPDGARFWAYEVGFPGDLLYISKGKYGEWLPAISECLIDRNHLFGRNGERSVKSVDCIQWHGSSGGPLLVWNPQRRKYEVLAVVSYGREGWTSVTRDLLAEASVVGRVEKLVTETKFPEPQRLTSEPGAYQAIPGIAAAFHGYRQATSSLYGDYRLLSKNAVDTIRGRATASTQTSQDSAQEDEGSKTRKGPEARVVLLNARKRCSANCTDSMLSGPGRTEGSRWLVNREQFVADKTALISKYWLITGGDLYFLDDNQVTGVVRQFMNLVRYGDAFDRMQRQRWPNFLPFEYSQAGLVISQYEDLVTSRTTAIRELMTRDSGAETPRGLPGGSTITTRELRAALDRHVPMVIVSVIKDRFGIPSAIGLPDAAGGESFSDEVQQRLRRDLERATKGDKNVAVIFYCNHVKCWSSYNGALRAVALGYPNVYWYRNGIDGWNAAGHQMASVTFLQ